MVEGRREHEPHLSRITVTEQEAHRISGLFDCFDGDLDVAVVSFEIAQAIREHLNQQLDLLVSSTKEHCAHFFGLPSTEPPDSDREHALALGRSDGVPAGSVGSKHGEAVEVVGDPPLDCLGVQGRVDTLTFTHLIEELEELRVGYRSIDGHDHALRQLTHNPAHEVIVLLGAQIIATKKSARRSMHLTARVRRRHDLDEVFERGRPRLLHIEREKGLLRRGRHFEIAPGLEAALHFEIRSAALHAKDAVIRRTCKIGIEPLHDGSTVEAGPEQEVQANVLAVVVTGMTMVVTVMVVTMTMIVTTRAVIMVSVEHLRSESRHRSTMNARRHRAGQRQVVREKEDGRRSPRRIDDLENARQPLILDRRHASRHAVERDAYARDRQLGFERPERLRFLDLGGVEHAEDFEVDLLMSPLRPLVDNPRNLVTGDEPERVDHDPVVAARRADLVHDVEERTFVLAAEAPCHERLEGLSVDQCSCVDEQLSRAIGRPIIVVDPGYLARKEPLTQKRPQQGRLPRPSRTDDEKDIQSGPENLKLRVTHYRITPSAKNVHTS